MQDNTIPFRPVEIQLASQSFAVDPGGTVVVPFLVVNHAGRADVYEISIEGIPLHWIALDAPFMRLPEGGQQAARLTIQAQGESPLSAGIYPVILRAVSQSDPSVQTENSFNLQVGAYEATRVMQPYQQAGVVGLRMDSSQFVIAPGESLTALVTLVNQGAFDETFSLSVDGIPPDWYALPVPVVRLLPGEAREVPVLLQPPLGPAGRAGRHTFRIRAASQSDPTQIAEADGVLMVSVTSQFTSDLNPTHSDTGRMARLRITNLSNIPESFEIRFQTLGPELDFVPVTPGLVQVQPGETAAFDFAVSPLRPTLFGGSSVVPYTVLVQASSGETQAHNADVVSRSLIPVWMLPALTLLCLGAICGLTVLWNWNQSRLTMATQTAQAQVAVLQAGTATAIYNQTQAALTGQQDTDGDALTDAQEQSMGTNPSAADTDSDRLSDGDEVRLGLNPLNPDTDADGIIDGLDLSPLDATNPLLTATAQAAQPIATSIPSETPVILPSAVPTNTLPAPAPTATFTQAPPPATATTAPVVQASPTAFPLPVTGQHGLGFVSNLGGSPDLYLLNAGETQPMRLTDNPAADSQPAWSPDGQRLAFTTNRDGNNEVYVVNADGSGLVNLTQNPANDTDPAWSPDGTRIVFTSDRDGNQEVYGVNLDGTNLLNLTQNPASDADPAWYSESGLLGSTNQILFTSNRDGNNEIYTANPDGSEPANLTQDPASDTQPAVSAQGGRVAFSSDREGSPDVFVMQPDGSAPINLTHNAAPDTSPAVSPDGAWVAFVSNRDGQTDIYLIPVLGGDPVNLTLNPAVEADPAWR